MGKVGGSVVNGPWDRAGVPMKAEGAVVWLATSKQKSSAPFDMPCCKQTTTCTQGKINPDKSQNHRIC